MESKTCNAFPVMENWPLCLHFAKFVQLFNFFCVKGFNSGPPAHNLFIYFDGEISTMSIEKYAQTMAVATYIAKEVLTCSPIGLLSYFILKPPCKPFRHIFKGSHIFSLQFMIGHQ